MWNDIPADIKLCKSMFTFKNNVQIFTLATLSIWLIAFVLLVCNDYI